MDVLFLKQFATPAEVSELRQGLAYLAQNQQLRAHPKAEFRFNRFLGEFPSAPAPIERLDRDLQKRFAIEGKCINLRDIDAANRVQATPSFIGMQLNSAFVQQHVDDNQGEMRQFRCTLLISKPVSGGRLVLAGNEYDMEEGDFYCFISNATMHGTTQITGPRPRMSCSFGYLVDKSFSLDAIPGVYATKA